MVAQMVGICTPRHLTGPARGAHGSQCLVADAVRLDQLAQNNLMAKQMHRACAGSSTAAEVLQMVAYLVINLFGIACFAMLGRLHSAAGASQVCRHAHASCHAWPCDYA